MLKNLNLVEFLVVVLSFAILCGCAKPPTKEIENAEKAIAEAKLKEADLYAQDVFMKAEDALKKTKELVGEKKYKEAKTVVENALSLAQQSISMIEPNKAKMKAESEQIILDVQREMEDIKALVVKAIRKKAQINREEIQAAIGKWEIDMVSAKEHLLAGKIRQAHDQLKLMQEQVKSQKKGVTATLETKVEGKK